MPKDVLYPLTGMLEERPHNLIPSAFPSPIFSVLSVFSVARFFPYFSTDG